MFKWDANVWWCLKLYSCRWFGDCRTRISQKMNQNDQICIFNVWPVFRFLPDLLAEPFLQTCTSDGAGRVNTSLLWTALLIGVQTVQRWQLSACCPAGFVAKLFTIEEKLCNSLSANTEVCVFVSAANSPPSLFSLLTHTKTKLS